MAYRQRLSCLLLALVTLWGCSYHYVAGPLGPSEAQGEGMTIADDGSLTFGQGRLEVTLRPMTDGELDRRTQAVGGVSPYTYEDVVFEDGLARSRFTVFLLSVKNYEFPKVVIDPAQVELIAANGRHYWTLNRQQLETYFRSYATGYRGNEYSDFQERMDVLNGTMYTDDAVFSGQENEGYVVFPVLHEDVGAVEVVVHDAALRFDFRDVPAEVVDIGYRFERKVGKKSWRESPTRTASVVH